MIKKKHIALFTFLLFSFGNHLFAQENPDAIALVDDQLENNFYEAMKQRGIENYDKAIVAIQKCIEKDSKNAAFQYINQPLPKILEAKKEALKLDNVKQLKIKMADDKAKRKFLEIFYQKNLFSFDFNGINLLFFGCCI
jgi:carbamoylphosphate synthase large subunit